MAMANRLLCSAARPNVCTYQFGTPGAGEPEFVFGQLGAAFGAANVGDSLVVGVGTKGFSETFGSGHMAALSRPAHCATIAGAARAALSSSARAFVTLDLAEVIWGSASASTLFCNNARSASDKFVRPAGP